VSILIDTEPIAFDTFAVSAFTHPDANAPEHATAG